MASTTIAHKAQHSSADFLSYLRSRFDDEEAHNFFTSFALTLEGKNDEFCIDLDEAYKCMNYASKQKALDLVKKLKLKETVDFSLNRSVEPNSPDKYLLKPAAFKKLLLSARTKAAQKAAEYFIKIEEAIPEFYNQGGTTFTPPRASDWKALPIDAYTARLTYKKPEGMIVSAGYNEDMSDPKAYFMRSGECTYPPGLVPDGAMVIDFGQTSDSRKRRADYERRTGVGEFLEHFPSPDPIRLERAIRRLAELEGRLVYGRRPDGTKSCEQAYVTSQTDYNAFAAKVYREQQKIIVEYCKLQAEREKRLTAEVELAKEKEKTQQLDRQVQISASEARRAEAEARARISDNELAMTKIRMEYSNVVIAADEEEKPQQGRYQTEDVDVTAITEEYREDNDPYSEYRAATLEQCSREVWLQWSDLLNHFRQWHDRRFPTRTLKEKGKDISAIKTYFTDKLGGFTQTSRNIEKDDGQKEKVNIYGFLGWRFRSVFLDDVSSNQSLSNSRD